MAKWFSLLLGFSILILQDSWNANAMQVYGRITGEGGEPISFANVFIKGTTQGTSANPEGFFRIELQPGHYILVFRHIGYRTLEREIQLSETDLKMDVVLQRENYNLKEVVISAGEDPAYEIMRKAIEKRKFYLEQVESFSCDVYIKGVQRLLKWPQKVLGKEVMIGQFVDTVSKIIYLSESVSKYFFEMPDRIHEEMISSRVSGSNKAFSWNKASDMQFNFYENLMETGITPRGTVSPVASNAMFYYRYRFEGSFIENGVTVNRIAVIPKRKYDPVYRGTIFIQDSTWRIHSLDLALTREAQIMFVDTLRIRQVFVPASVDGSVWMNATSQFEFHFDVFGFEGNGNYTGVFSNYVLNPPALPVNKRGEVMRIHEDANKKDSAYWEKIRPVPLTEIEALDYVRKDSMREVRESKPYLDSLDQRSNRLTPGKIFFSGYEYRQRFRKQEFHFSPLIQNVQFNTVEGLNIGLASSYIKTYEGNRRRRLQVSPMIGYDASAREVHGVLGIEYNFNRIKFESVSLEGGMNAVQFNADNPINPVWNTWYSLLEERNYMKIYDKLYVASHYSRELVNGIKFTTGAEYAERTPLVNTTDYKFRNVEGREFSSNNPLLPGVDTPAFLKNQSLIAEVLLNFAIRQQYISRPDQKIITGSPFPAFSLRIRQGINRLAGSDVNYTMITAGISDEISFGLFGTLQFETEAGFFPVSSKMFFMDYRHFRGNQILFSTFALRKFNLLDYYSRSTREPFAEAHAEYHFNGFILNKIPLLRKLKLDEVAGFHYLKVKGLHDYYECSIGLSKFELLRLDLVLSFEKDKQTGTAIRIYLAGF